MRAVFFVLIMVLLAGCVQPFQPVKRIPFPEAEYKALETTGTGIVRGQAFLKTRGGDVKVAAGNEVLLSPVTSYSLDWYNNSYLANKAMESIDPRFNQYVRTVTADSNGKFIFRRVPSGEYFVTTEVTWEAPVGYQGALVMQGGVVTKRIMVMDGEEVEVIIAK